MPEGKGIAQICCNASCFTCPKCICQGFHRSAHITMCAGMRRGARRESSSWRRRLRRCKQRQAMAAAQPLAQLLVRVCPPVTAVTSTLQTQWPFGYTAKQSCGQLQVQQLSNRAAQPAASPPAAAGSAALRATGKTVAELQHQLDGALAAAEEKERHLQGMQVGHPSGCNAPQLPAWEGSRTWAACPQGMRMGHDLGSISPRYTAPVSCLGGTKKLRCLPPPHGIVDSPAESLPICSRCAALSHRPSCDCVRGACLGV